MLTKLYKNILCCKVAILFALVFICLLGLAGCSPTLSTKEELKHFQSAGPIIPQVDVNRLLNAKIHTGYYRVIPGDILELQMPAVLRVVSSDLAAWFGPTTGHDDVEPYLIRVNDAGYITLPIIGKISVVGLTLTEIEILLVNTYYPQYVESLPSLFCKVKEYQIQNVTILGGVVRPGLYKLNSDEMSLVAALMKAGGVIDEGAALITVQHSKLASAKQGQQVDLTPIVLPVKDLNIPFSDTVLLDGDTIRVEKLNPEVFTVLGPVGTPGVYPYPPDVKYNLMQSLAFAGGLDMILDPRYVTIYRQDADGQIVTATFHIDDRKLSDASALLIKPGDVISVEMTADVRARLIIREMLDIRFGYDLNNMND